MIVLDVVDEQWLCESHSVTGRARGWGGAGETEVGADNTSEGEVEW